MRLIAVDLDGTFLDSRGRYDRPRFERVHERLRTRGIHFIVASGNQRALMQEKFAGFPGMLFAAENGAQIGSQEEVLANHPIPPRAARATLRILDGLPDLLVVRCGADVASVTRDYPPDELDAVRAHYPLLERLASWDDANGRCLKIAVGCKAAETGSTMDVLRQQLPLGVTAVSAFPGGIDIMRSDVNKGSALKWLGSELRIGPDEMVAFGDADNDLEMLLWVGTSVAMQNANPAVLAAADHVTLSNEDSGVIAWLEELLQNLENEERHR